MISTNQAVEAPGDPRQALTEDQCPLLPANQKPSLVTLYNRVRDLFCLIEQECSEDVRLGEGWDDLERVLADAWRRLTRQRYRVGFLGPNQSGKSTTFNRLVKDKVAKEGDAAATTAAVMRLWAEKGGERRLTLRYLNETEYVKKKVSICQHTGLAPHLSDDAMLTRIDEQIRKIQDPRAVLTEREREQQKVGIDNLKYLALLLRSYQAYQDRLGREDRGSFEDRDAILNHAKGDYRAVSAPRSPLLRDVIVHFPTDQIPKELEMIDLPGLGSGGVYDDLLTEPFLEDMDGALVFCPANRVQNDEMVRILSELRASLGTFRGRVWVVYTNSDGLAGQLRGDSTVFHVIRRWTHEQEGVPLEQICFISNKPEKLQADDRGLPALGESSLEQLSAAWEDLFADGEGGLSRLSAILQRELARQVAEANARRVQESLQLLGESLLALGRRESQTPQIDEHLIAQTQSCLDRLVNLTVELRGGRDKLQSQARLVREGLLEAFDEFQLRAKTLDELKNLPKKFEQHANRLEMALEKILRTQAVDSAYNMLRPEIERMEDGRPLHVPSVLPEGLVRQWDKYLAQDKTHDGWRDAAFPSFKAYSPFENLAGGVEPPFNGEQYIAMLREKVRVVSRQAAEALRRRLCGRLDGVIGQLTAFVDEGYQERQAVRSEELRNRLRDFDGLFGNGGA